MEMETGTTPSTLSMPVVRLEHLHKAFGEQVILKDIDLELQAGTITAIMGSSGSGKSTLLNMIGLIEPCLEGGLWLFGKPAPKANSRQSLSYLQRRISFVFQNFALAEDLCVRENLEIALHHRHLSSREKKERMRRVLEVVGLPGMEKRKVYTLSGGQQQRIALARTLLKGKSLVLCDEPTASLDEDNKQRVLQLLEDMARHGYTILIATHDLQTAGIADAVWYLEEGRLKLLRPSGSTSPSLETSDPRKKQTDVLKA